MLSKFEYDGELNPHFKSGPMQLPIESVRAYLKEPVTPRCSRPATQKAFNLRAACMFECCLRATSFASVCYEECLLIPTIKKIILTFPHHLLPQ